MPAPPPTNSSGRSDCRRVKTPNGPVTWTSSPSDSSPSASRPENFPSGYSLIMNSSSPPGRLAMLNDRTSSVPGIVMSAYCPA